MRVTSWTAAALVVLLAAPALAQEDWDNFKFTDDGFEVNFPGRPTIANTTWVSQYRYNLPAKVYSASHGREQYKVTVVDYRPVLKLGEERAKQCPAGAETCIGEVLEQDHRVEFAEGLGHSMFSGYAVTNRGPVTTSGTIQTATTAALTPVGPRILPRIKYFCPNGPGTRACASPTAAWAIKAAWRLAHPSRV